MTIKTFLKWDLVFNRKLYCISSSLSTLFLCLICILISTWGKPYLKIEKTPFCWEANATHCESFNKKFWEKGLFKHIWGESFLGRQTTKKRIEAIFSLLSLFACVLLFFYPLPHPGDSHASSVILGYHSVAWILSHLRKSWSFVIGLWRVRCVDDILIGLFWPMHLFWC